jgi:ribosomal protein S18 acetylase RimI-like enzyme
MENFNIRLANTDDISRINELFIQMIKYVNEQNKKSGKKVDEERFKDGYDEGFLEDYLARPDKFILVADIDSEVVGYLSCEEHYEDETSYIYLDDFCVDYNYRGLGIGTSLISSADEYASNNNFGDLRLHVENENINSIRFYNNLGFLPLSKDDNRTLMQRIIIKKNLIK